MASDWQRYFDGVAATYLEQGFTHHTVVVRRIYVGAVRAATALCRAGYPTRPPRSVLGPRGHPLYPGRVHCAPCTPAPATERSC